MFILLLVVALVAMTALYVAAEFATVAARRFRIEAMANQGNPTARLLLPHLEDATALDRYVAACQIGITASSLLLGAYGQGRLAELLQGPLQRGLSLGDVAVQSIAATIVLLGLTGVQVVLGELVPKAVALRFPESVALALTRPMLASLWLYAWFIRVLNGVGNRILRAMGVVHQPHRHVHSPEELEQMLAHGSDQSQENARLRRVFRFGDRTLREVMVPRTRIVGIERGSGWAELDRLLQEHPFTRLPVYRETLDQVLGVVHLKDLAVADRSAPLDLGEHLRELLVLPSSLSLETAMLRLREQSAQMALLADEYGGTEGLVTVEDLVEEVLGEIHDEFDPSRPAIEVLEPGRWSMRGEVLLDDVRAELGLAQQVPDVHTVGGLFLHHCTGRPQPGQCLELDGLRFEVTETRGARIVRLEVRGAP